MSFDGDNTEHEGRLESLNEETIPLLKAILFVLCEMKDIDIDEAIEMGEDL